MTFPKLKALGVGIGLFVAVYVPAFMTTAFVRPRIEIAIPLIIAITFLVALILVFLLARPPAGIAEFGFRIPNSRYVAIAIVFGLTLGLAVTFSLFGGSVSAAVVFTAVLFGVIHLEAGAVVALGAIILGLVAGEFRRRSGSLLPAIIVHALFNSVDAVWR